MNGIFDESRLRALIKAAVNDALSERRPEPDAYLSVARAAEVAEVAPATIRAWIAEKRLTRYRAGRELRVKHSELDRLLSVGWSADLDDDAETLARRIVNR
jgi:excisionase family DNA binding protein